MFDEITCPYTKQWKAGSTYEWPGVPFCNAVRANLRMTLCADGRWSGETHRGNPWIFEPDPVTSNLIITQPCCEITWKTVTATHCLHLGDKVYGGTVVGGQLKRDFIGWAEEWTDENGDYSPRHKMYGNQYIPYGGKARIEMRGELR